MKTGKRPRKTPDKATRGQPPPPGEVRFTTLDRVVFPDTGYTKGDVIKFYLSVADRLVPHLRDRPMTLERVPEGVKEGAPHFWQKNTPSYYPAWIPRIKLPTA